MGINNLIGKKVSVFTTNPQIMWEVTIDAIETSPIPHIEASDSDGKKVYIPVSQITAIHMNF